MSITTFQGFLAAAGLHPKLLVDLCAEPGLISRARLLTYMERYGIEPADKDRLIERYCRTSILYEETDFEYSVNPVVAGLVNFYERRGRLTHADFLRDQIFEIGKLTDTLQQLLFSETMEMDLIIDTVDKLYLVVREVRESGYQHYQACMRAFGDMKRNSAEKPIDIRIEELRTVHRRYIEPLRELIDPNAEPVRKIAMLRRRMADLSNDAGLLSESVELDTRRARLATDIQYIDHTLIRHFETLIDTSRALLNSLLEEKSIKDALAACLGNFDAIWENLAADTLVLTGFQASQTAGMDRQGAFFNDVAHGKFIPRPRPLSITPPKEERADHLLLFDDLLLSRMKKDGPIESWPSFVIREYAAYPPDERLKAIALPLIMANPPFAVRMHNRTFLGDLTDFAVELTDFAIVWEEAHGR